MESREPGAKLTESFGTLVCTLPPEVRPCEHPSPKASLSAGPRIFQAQPFPRFPLSFVFCVHLLMRGPVLRVRGHCKEM